MLLPRVLTALIGLPFLLGAIYYGGLPYFFVIAGVILLALREFYFLAEETGYPTYRTIGLTAGVLITISVFLNGLGFGSVAENQASAALISLFILVVVTRSLSKGPADTTLSEWSVTFFGVFYVAWSLSHLILLRDLRPTGMPATFFLFVLIWVADVTAYWVGSRLGRHKIAESISPKKTWEGTIGGVIGAVVVGVLFHFTALKPYSRLAEIIIVSAITAILAFWSDLGESMLKRAAGAKDSSPILPGHGGILDRFDSFILTAPFFYYYWAFAKH
jgi:phosphatidate cytidylyltransferase